MINTLATVVCKQTNKKNKQTKKAVAAQLSPHLLDGDFTGSGPYNIGILPSHIKLSSLQQDTENMAGVDTHTY